MKNIIEQASHYKRKIAGAYLSINQEDISSKISGDKLYISTKLDGEFNLLHFDGEKSILVNANGVIKEDFTFLESATKSLKEKSISSLTAAVELHLNKANKRSRVFEVMSAITSDKESLTVSAFDLLELNNDECSPNDYQETINQLKEIFDNNDLISPVTLTTIAANEVNEVFEETVVQGGAEGLVIRSPDMPIVYKLKPLYTLDVAVIGFTEGDENTLRDFLFAVQKEDGTFVQIGHAGNGLSDEQKVELYQTLSKEVVQSSYIEVDKRRVAFRMVKPSLVIEVSLNELLTENTKGNIKNHILSYNETDGYSFVSSTNGVSLIHPVFKRVRSDKQVNDHDVRYSQITDIVYLENSDESQNTALPESEIIFREVYTKKAKGKTNVLKFLAWKTNKEEIDSSYPAYVMNYTNFSPTRGDPLKRDFRVSSSKEQILALLQGFIDKNVKKGWVKV